MTKTQWRRLLMDPNSWRTQETTKMGWEIQKLESPEVMEDWYRLIVPSDTYEDYLAPVRVNGWEYWNKESVRGGKNIGSMVNHLWAAERNAAE